MVYTLPDIPLLPVLPVLILSIGGLIVLVRTTVAGRSAVRGLPVLTLLILAATALAVVAAALSSHRTAFGGMLQVDAVALWFSAVFLITTALTTILASRHFRNLGADRHELYPLLLFSTLGMMLMAAAGNLVLVFVGLELMSIALYIMAAMAGTRSEGSNEAALKYLLLGAFATGFLVYGVAMLYGATASLHLGSIDAAIRNGGAQLGYLRIGLALVTIGLGFKVALVPFHMWAPDVYEGSPTVVTAFMSVGPKVAGFAAIWRVLVLAAGARADDWGPMLVALSVLTMLVGNLAALGQTNIKRLFAFSSIAHAGYMSLGVVANSAMGTQGLLYYALLYAFLSLAAFTVILIANGDGNDRLSIVELRGLGKRCPLAAASLAVAVIAMAGIPPLSGFYGKYLLFAAAVRSGYVAGAALGILCSVISVYYYFRLIVLMYMQAPAEGAQPIRVDGWTRLVLIATLIGTIVLSIPPWPLAWLAGWCAG